MNRLTQHSKTTMFTDSDVIVEGQRLGPAAFEGLSYYRHYVKIINRLAELEDRFCNEPQTKADRIRAFTDEELATWVETIAGCDLCPVLDEQCSGGEVTSHASCKRHWLEWLRQEAEEGAGTT